MAFDMTQYAEELFFRWKRLAPNEAVPLPSFRDAKAAVEYYEEALWQLRLSGVKEEDFKNENGVKNVMDVKITTESTYSLTIDGMSDRCLGALINYLRKIKAEEIREDGRLKEVIDFREQLDEAFYEAKTGKKRLGGSGA